MSKKLVIGAVVGTAVAVGVVSAAKSQSGPKPSMWEKMREAMDEMPEDFPPRVMFANMEAIKANTDEIVALLRQKETDGE
jgi:hypothetical protein